ncbi:MAG: hypothetical protein HC840_10475 [Leptolyngbyaceae cyanobacterium RM2_2_4]|nr:hypothetical protein [Leptolyngbyaceae cyanobacterium RM2_2_4]
MAKTPHDVKRRAYFLKKVQLMMIKLGFLPGKKLANSAKVRTKYAQEYDPDKYK